MGSPSFGAGVGTAGGGGGGLRDGAVEKGRWVQALREGPEPFGEERAVPWEDTPRVHFTDGKVEAWGGRSQLAGLAQRWDGPAGRRPA